MLRQPLVLEAFHTRLNERMTGVSHKASMPYLVGFLC